jgi:type IV pilus assembly protein PilV
MPTCKASRSAQYGFSMLEILVALLIIATALLGSAGLQAYAMKTNVGGQYRNQAAFLLEDMIERMELNKAYATSAGYSSALAMSVDCGTAICTPAQLAGYDVSQWQTAIAAVLPSGTGTVTQVTAGNPSTYTVTINWVDRKTNATYSTGGATENFSISTSTTLSQ